MPTNYKSVDWASYESLSEDDPHSIVWASTGGDGSGKSTFGLTAPGPILVCAFDPFGMNRVHKQFKVNKDIRIRRYPFNPLQLKDPKEIAKVATDTWDAFVGDYRLALKKCKTVLWDREDIAWELLRHASFGAVSSAPKEYADLNSEYVSLIQEAYAAGVNLGLLRGLREKWISKMDPAKGKLVAHNTGELIADGFKKVPDHVDVTLTHRWDPVTKSFLTTIEKFPNPMFRGDSFPDFTFTQMGMAAYPESGEEEWQ